MNDPLAPLRARFLDRCRDDLAVLRLGPAHPEFGHTVHRLAGAGGTFGFPELSRLAAVLDDQAMEGLAADPTDLEALVRALEELTA